MVTLARMNDFPITRQSTMSRELHTPIRKSKQTILIVEDSAIVAMDLEETLEEAGYKVLGPAQDIETAINIVENQQVDGALLDIDLQGSKSFSVAEKLRARHVPFAFISGYKGEETVPPELKDCLCLEKPLDEASVLLQVKALLNKSSPEVKSVIIDNSHRSYSHPK